jgi:hypothetical protein
MRHVSSLLCDFRHSLRMMFELCSVTLFFHSPLQQPWNDGDFTFLVLCGITVEDLLNSSIPGHHAQSSTDQIDSGEDDARSMVRTQVLCTLAAAKSVINSSWLDSCVKHQRLVSFQPHELLIVPSLPLKWHRHMIKPLFSRCSVLPISCSAHVVQLLVAGAASIQSRVASPSKNSYPPATIVVITSGTYTSDCADSPMLLLLASLGFPVVFSTFFEDWARFAAPPPRKKHELPEAAAAAAAASMTETLMASNLGVSAENVAQAVPSDISSSVFQHTVKKNAKCSICRGSSVQSLTGMHIVDITDTSTSGHLVCFQWLCGNALPALATVQVCLL